MTLFDSIILGIVQGLTEFLPVSSSGHLVIFQRFLGLEEPGVTLEVLLHFGTLLSIVWVFKSDFLQLLKFRTDPVQRRFLVLLIIGTAATGVIGFLLRPYVINAFASTMVVGFLLLVTGVILWIINLLTAGRKEIETMENLDAIWIGVFQGLAIFPGISRSGSTILGALWRGLDRATAVRYSFILTVPAILGATLWEARELDAGELTGSLILNYAAGMATAFIFGIVAIKVFISLLQKKKFNYFSYYCWIVGSGTIVLSLINR